MPIVHLTRTLPALQPRYVTRFKCLGPQCEDNCCREWHVALDKPTFDAYSQGKDPQMGTRMAQAVRINPQPSELDYGRIVFDPAAGSCPLLEGNLCGVHKHLGESALSHTCYTYPRYWTQVTGQYEESLELSCPEAARQALLAPDAFEFIEGTMTVRPDLVRNATPNGDFAPEMINEVRIFCLNLMRIEGLALWQRLAVLGLFCESLAEPVARCDNTAMRALMASFASLVERGDLLDTLAALQPDHDAQAMLFATLWAGMPLVTPNAARNEVINAVSHGLGADPQTGQVAGERLVACYRQGLARLPEALQAAPHLLEHYVLNEMFLHLFPFDSPNPFDSYLRLVARYGLLRLMLAARCNTNGALPDANALVQTVQVHCRRFNHDYEFIARVDAALASHGWARLDKLYTLLRT